MDISVQAEAYDKGRFYHSQNRRRENEAAAADGLPLSMSCHLVQAGALVSGFDEILWKNVADSRTRRSLLAHVLEKRLIKLFGAIEMMFS
jgi:hypothetical protein